MDVKVTREHARRDLVAMIDRMPGPKALVIDPTISGPLGLIAEMQLLKEHGVEKSLHLKAEPLNVPQRRIIYLVRNSVSNMKVIAEQIRCQSKDKNRKFSACIGPCMFGSSFATFRTPMAIDDLLAPVLSQRTWNTSFAWFHSPL
jgi:hypothetical protein